MKGRGTEKERKRDLNEAQHETRVVNDEDFCRNYKEVKVTKKMNKNYYNKMNKMSNYENN